MKLFNTNQSTIKSISVVDSSDLEGKSGGKLTVKVNHSARRKLYIPYITYHWVFGELQCAFIFFILSHFLRHKGKCSFALYVIKGKCFFARAEMRLKRKRFSSELEYCYVFTEEFSETRLHRKLGEYNTKCCTAKLKNLINRK